MLLPNKHVSPRGTITTANIKNTYLEEGFKTGPEPVLGHLLEKGTVLILLEAVGSSESAWGHAKVMTANGLVCRVCRLYLACFRLPKLP